MRNKNETKLFGLQTDFARGVQYGLVNVNCNLNPMKHQRVFLFLERFKRLNVTPRANVINTSVLPTTSVTSRILDECVLFVRGCVERY